MKSAAQNAATWPYSLVVSVRAARMWNAYASRPAPAMAPERSHVPRQMERPRPPDRLSALDGRSLETHSRKRSRPLAMHGMRAGRARRR